MTVSISGRFLSFHDLGHAGFYAFRRRNPKSWMLDLRRVRREGTNSKLTHHLGIESLDKRVGTY